MRLTCPNCDAQYEVPDEVIPTSGRDVQCSNCGQTWFQHHADHMPEHEGSDLEFGAPEYEYDEEVAPPPPPPQPDPKPERKELDPSVAEILRQEAAAEQAARRARQSPEALETQPELGLSEADTITDTEEGADRRAREARDRMARMRGEEPLSEAAATAAAIGSRRDLLPDIEEINSTLRSTSDRASGMSDMDPKIDAPTRQRQKHGFRFGFWLIVLVAFLLILLYIFSPQLSQAVPALDSALTNYVAMMDKGRLWLDGQLQSFLAWLEAAASQSSGS